MQEFYCSCHVLEVLDTAFFPGCVKPIGRKKAIRLQQHKTVSLVMFMSSFSHMRYQLDCIFEASFDDHPT